MRIEKAYFTVPEVLARWSLSREDLIYLAENDRLRLSVRVFGLTLEFGAWEETVNGHACRVCWDQSRYSGLLDLLAHDIFHLFRCGERRVSDFRTPEAPYARLCDDAEPVLVTAGDLLLRREERDRFETETGFSGSGATINAGAPAFSASPGYIEVLFRERRFRLGAIQAQVVRALHLAALGGDPWRNGKAILTSAGSKSLKMSDVFKSQEHWRELIESDGRGSYRLRSD